MMTVHHEPTNGRTGVSSKEVFMKSASRMLLVFSLSCAVVCLGTTDPRAARAGGSGQASQGAPSRRPANQTRSPSGFSAQWIGQDGQDWTGTGPAVGPDGLEDVHIALCDLTAGVAIKAIRIEGSGKTTWEYGKNPKLLSNAELVRDTKDPSRGELYFQPNGDLKGQRLRLMLAYDNDKVETTTVVAGRSDAALKVPASPLPQLKEGALQATWLGQDGGNTASPGDVHVAVTGLPAAVSIVGCVLTDAVRATWIYRGSDRASIPDDPNALPLVFKPRSDGKAIDLFFAPFRDESTETMTLRVITADGQGYLLNFPGQSCDFARMAPAPEPSRSQARPGVDLQALVDKYGTLVLAPGTYRLARPLVLNRPVTITSEGGATLLFDQAATEPAWSSAIKVHCGNTTLNGFAVRFAGPVRWNNEISWGPAVIGMTDNLDPYYEKPRYNIAFTHLDLEIPPVADPFGWVDALRLMRLIRAKNGVIAGNTLRGGPIELFDGPWQIVDNDYRGTVLGTHSQSVFTAHGGHDLIIRNNRAHNLAPAGKTWRFLVLTWQGYADLVEGNNIEGLGSLEGDTVPWCNAPEIILTEAYHVRYEGKVMALSSDGRLLRIGRPQSVAGRTGDIVALLKGPAAGEWRRIVQAIDASTYLVDRAIPPATTVVSISQGFVGEVFQDNRIDIRGGRRSFGLVLVGNHFGTRVVKNHLLGGIGAFRLTACPTETPMMWGWTHAPFLGGQIDGNIMEDCEAAGTLGLEHDPRYIKSNVGRTYMAARFDHNIVRWTEPFLRRMAREKTVPVGVTLGYPPSHDPGELVVHAAGNRLEAATAKGLDPSVVPTLIIHASEYNSQRIVNRRFRLPADGSAALGVGREASKRPTTSAR
jgi:hypothetical protein